MKLVLVAINAKYIHSNLAVRYLQAFTQDLPGPCAILEFSLDDQPEKMLPEILACQPDVVGFSTYLWNFEIVRRLSTLLKIIRPTIEILYGGPEVSYDSSILLGELSGDYLISGEGEQSFRQFVEYKLGRLTVEQVAGLTYKVNEEIRGNPPPPQLEIETLAFPYQDFSDLDDKIIYYEASRGCPFSCAYCLSATFAGVRHLPLARVKSELAKLLKRKVRLIKFVDRTFNAQPSFARSVWEFLIKETTETTFHFEICADLLRAEDFELLKTAPAGRLQFEVGVQSTNPEVLKQINRPANFAQLRKNVLKLGALKNVKQHLDLIAGLPGENADSFKQSFNDVHGCQPEEIQLGFLKLLPGSSLRRDAEKSGLKYSPYSPYEVLRTPELSYEELRILKNIAFLVDKYHNSQKFRHVLALLVAQFASPYDFYWALQKFFDERGYLKMNIRGDEYYRLFLDFNEQTVAADAEVLGDLVKFDYLLTHKKKGLPSFAWRAVTKAQEQEFQAKLRPSYDLKNNYLERFCLDVSVFRDQGQISKRPSYFLFNQLGEASDVSALLIASGAA